MFPHLKPEQAEYLASTGDEYTVLVTRVLDNNIDPIRITVHDVITNAISPQEFKPEYNYPEVFNGIRNYSVKSFNGTRDYSVKSFNGTRDYSVASFNGTRDYSIKSSANYSAGLSSNDMTEPSVAKLRERGNERIEEAMKLTKKAVYNDLNKTRLHYITEADRKWEEAGEIHRKAAVAIMRRAMESTGPLDFHGLYVKEAEMFLDDLYLFKNFREIRIATGQKYNSPKLRVCVEEWLRKHGFMAIDEGPVVCGLKRAPK